MERRLACLVKGGAHLWDLSQYHAGPADTLTSMSDQMKAGRPPMVTPTIVAAEPR